jgi:hypothetical protein
MQQVAPYWMDRLIPQYFLARKGVLSRLCKARINPSRSANLESNSCVWFLKAGPSSPNESWARPGQLLAICEIASHYNFQGNTISNRRSYSGAYTEARSLIPCRLYTLLKASTMMQNLRTLESTE